MATTDLADQGAPGERLPPAGPGRRLLATLVDMTTFCGLTALLVFPLLRSLDWDHACGGFDELVAELSDPTWLSHAAGILGIWVGLWWAYFVIGWGMCGATLGKWITGLRIVDDKFRCPIGIPRSLLRLVAYSISSLTLGVGHLLVAFRSDRRALHDLLAGTRVVRRRRSTLKVEG